MPPGHHEGLKKFCSPNYYYYYCCYYYYCSPICYGNGSYFENL